MARAWPTVLLIAFVGVASCGRLGFDRAGSDAGRDRFLGDRAADGEPEPDAQDQDAALDGEVGGGDGGPADADGGSEGGFAAGGVLALVAGDAHTCILRGPGEVLCWGGNESGQLGDGATDDRSTPALVPGVAATALAAGADYTCALDAAGALWCWGSNGLGQFGSGDTASSSAPRRVLDGPYDKLSARLNVTCVGDAAGLVWCFGDNAFGTVGPSAGAGPVTVPSPVLLPEPAVQVLTTGYTSCARLAGGAVHCWGFGDSGGLGDGAAHSRPEPGPVDLVDDAVDLAGASEHVCAVRSGGEIWCWGGNYAGQVDPTDPSFSIISPRRVAGVVGAAGVACTQSSTCARTAGGAVWCWGSNAQGQVGAGRAALEVDAPAVPVGLAATVERLAAGAWHVCALHGGDALSCFGANWVGQLGVPPPTTALTPAPVVELPSVVRVATGGSYAGRSHSCAVDGAGALRCWGTDEFVRPADGRVAIPWPTAIPVAPVAEAVLGYAHTCLRLADGTVVCHGVNDAGQLGDGTLTYQSAYAPALLLSSVTDLAGQNVTHCAVEAGAVYCWGRNFAGAAGADPAVVSELTTPTEVLGLGTTQGVAVGDNHSCALDDVGDVRCWGSNTSGQLGDGTSVSRHVPALVLGLPEATVAVAAGGNITCALAASGSLRCWGYRPGDGSSGARSAPVEVLSGVAAIDVGGSGACAILTEGTLRCWGRNSTGTVGDGTTDERLTPVPVPDLTGVAQVSVGAVHTCAALAAGGARCWGTDEFSELGTGRARFELEPVAVPGFP